MWQCGKDTKEGQMGWVGMSEAGEGASEGGQESLANGGQRLKLVLICASV